MTPEWSHQCFYLLNLSINGYFFGGFLRFLAVLMPRTGRGLCSCCSINVLHKVGQGDLLHPEVRDKQGICSFLFFFSFISWSVDCTPLCFSLLTSGINLSWFTPLVLSFCYFTNWHILPLRVPTWHTRTLHGLEHQTWCNTFHLACSIHSYRSSVLQEHLG